MCKMQIAPSTSPTPHPPTPTPSSLASFVSYGHASHKFNIIYVIFAEIP